MNGYLGSYRHSLDSKGRVSLPAAFRRRGGESFVLLRFHDDALTLYPDEAWSDVEQELREMLERRPDFRHLVLRITGNAQHASLDGQGRILIPDRLRGEAGLDDDVLIVGALDKIELWSPEKFEERTSEAEADSEFEELAASIFA